MSGTKAEEGVFISKIDSAARTLKRAERAAGGRSGGSWIR